MAEYRYAVWLRNDQVPPTDEDHEWLAAFLVAAPTEKAALEWGNHLAHDYCKRTGEQFISASIESPQAGAGEDLPVVAYGDEPPDQDIGW
jgi:hypothetical protein